MKAVLDACVLFPPVLREMLTGVAAAGLFQPLWSDRILEEWARACTRLGAGAEAQARVEAALLNAAFPRASIRAQPDLEARLALPDPGDVHVLAVAVAGHADAIITLNAKDFPQHLLAAEGLRRRDPDGFLWEVWSHHPGAVEAVVTRVHARAEALSGGPVAARRLLKKAQLPRLARAMGL